MTDLGRLGAWLARSLPRRCTVLSHDESRVQTRWPPVSAVLQYGPFAKIGVCGYLLAIVTPVGGNAALVVLSVFGSLAVAAAGLRRQVARWPLLIPLVGFLACTGLSAMASEDVGRSVRLSAPLLPAFLLFVLISRGFRDLRDVRALYVAECVAALGLATLVIAVAWTNPGASASTWVAKTDSPIVIVPNDVTVLAVIAPLSLVLLYRDPRRLVRITAGLSIALSVGVVLLVRSRVAALTMIGSLACAAALLRPRLGLVWGAGSVLLALGVDGLLGFPLVAKFSHVLDTRIAFWLVASAMFNDAPLLGRGPRTFGVFYHAYLRTLKIPDWLPIDHGVVPWAHNLYLEALAEQGVVGLAALGLVLWVGLRLAWKARAAGSGEEARVLGVGALAGLLGFCVAGLFELTLLRLWVVTVLFVFLGAVARLSTVETDGLEKPGCERSVTLAQF